MAVFDPYIYTEEYVRVRAVPTRHTSTYIFCHGKGQTGKQWITLIPRLRKLGHCDHVAFIFPYFEFADSMSESDIRRAAALVRKIVADEIVKGITADRIAVGGIDEGFEIGLLATVGDSTKIAGSLGLLGVQEGLDYTNLIVAEKKASNAETPVYLIDHNPAAHNRAVKELLEKIGQPIGSLVNTDKNLAAENHQLSSQVYVFI